MAITKQQAIEIVKEKIGEEPELDVDLDGILERDDGWIISVLNKEYLRTRDSLHITVGGV